MVTQALSTGMSANICCQLEQLSRNNSPSPHSLPILS